MNFKIIFLLGAILILSVKVNAQITVSKNNISVNDSITVYFNPTLGNKRLSGVNQIYIYTGLITFKSRNNVDWQYIPTQWSDNNEKFILKRINDTCYCYGMNIKKFYNLPDDENVYRIGLFFRNIDYSRIGFTEDDEYFYIDLVQNGCNFKSYEVLNNQLKITTDLFVYTVQLFENNLLKFDFQKNEELSTSQKMSFLKDLPNINLNLKDNDSNLVFQNQDFKTIIKKEPVSFTIIKQADTIIKNLRLNNNFGWHYEYDSESRIYGGGASTPQLDNNKSFMKLYNRAIYLYDSKALYTHCSIPFFISSDLYSIYYDSPSKASIDFGKYSKGVAEYCDYSSPTPIYIQIGNSYEELVSDFSALIGRAPLPAYWSLGYLQSNFAYWNQWDIMKRLPLYKQFNIPCEAIMIDYFWAGGEEKIGDNDWDYGYNYPKPKELLDDLRKNNMKCLLISEPYITIHSFNFQRFYDNNLFSLKQDGTQYVLDGYRNYKFGIVDIFNPSTKDEVWKSYKARYDEGISGWWCDLSEPEAHPEDMYHFGGYTANEIHNIYIYLYSEMLFKKFSEYKPNERPVHFYRGGFSGMQKFGAFLWTGDVLSTYQGLRAQIPIMLGLGVGGMNMVASDAGGFAAKRKNSLLYTRWIQYASFSPILRPHSNNLQPPEPFYHDEPYLSICRNYINLRYRLLPYIYTLCYDVSTTGRPLVMQMDFFEMQNKELQNNNTQYFFGKDFIVAPILDSINKREVVLPNGVWYEFKNNTRYLGNQTLNMEYDSTDIPIFVRGGAIIPTTYSVLSTELFKYDYYKFLCYSDTSITESEGKMYVDNGKNPKAIEQKAYELITVKMKNLSDKLTFELKKEGNGFQEFSSAVFEMQVFNTKFYESVFLNGDLLPLHSLFSDFENSNLGVYYDTKERILHIKYPWNHQQDNFIECVRSNSVLLTKNIKIYPNPTNGKLVINILETDFSSSSFDMALYSETGDKILSRTYNHQKAIELDLTKLKLSFGVYFVEIKIADKTLKYKIIYER